MIITVPCTTSAVTVPNRHYQTHVHTSLNRTIAVTDFLAIQSGYKLSSSQLISYPTILSILLAKVKMKLLSVLTVCAALCIAVTQASPQLQEEEADQGLNELLEMLSDQAEAEMADVDEEIAAKEFTRSDMLTDKEKAKAQWGIRIPRIRIPRITIPRIRIPRITIPRITIPRIRIPRITIPRITIPRIRIPRITIPRIRIPRITIPRIRIPRIGGRWKKK